MAAGKAAKAKATNPVQNTLVQALDEDFFTVATAGKQTLNLPKVPQNNHNRARPVRPSPPFSAAQARDPGWSATLKPFLFKASARPWS